MSCKVFIWLSSEEVWERIYSCLKVICSSVHVILKVQVVMRSQGRNGIPLPANKCWVLSHAHTTLDIFIQQRMFSTKKYKICFKGVGPCIRYLIIS